jgi:hemolysin activation/secretion protein
MQFTGKAQAGAVVAACMLAFGAMHAHAQQSDVPAPLELRFDIQRYVVEGNTLLTADELARLTSPFAGSRRDFGDVQRALEALENAYRARGYAAVQVYVPEQDMEKGTVLLRVVEPRIRRVEVTGNKFFDEPNIRASLPSVKEGSVPNSSAIAANLRVANENPAKQTNVTLRTTDQPGMVDARADVTDHDPSRWFVTLDNTGSQATGYVRAGVGYQNSNVLNRDHGLTLQYVTSDRPEQVNIFSVGYRVPLYDAGASVDLIAGYSDVDNGVTSTTAGPLQFSGKGSVLGLRLNKHLPRIVGLDHRLIFGVDYRDYRNACSLGALGAAGCGTAGASFAVRPLSVTYSALWSGEQAQTGFHATVAGNVPGGSDGNGDALARARPGTDPSYMVYRFGASHARALPGDWQARVAVLAQHSEVPLVAPEQFGIGGQGSVRGFQEREVSADRGHSATFEVYTPDLGGGALLQGTVMRLLGFYDMGRVQRVDPAPGDIAEQGISAAGIGARLNRGRDLSVRTDLAQTLNAGGARRKGSLRWSFALVWGF